MSSSACSEALVTHEDLPLPVVIRGVRGARRLRLRLDEKRRILKLTGPLRMNRKAALKWAAEQREWIAAQLEATPPPEPFEPGASIPLEGEDVLLQWAESAARTPQLDGKRLICGGSREGFARRIEGFLKRRALQILSEDTAEAARLADVKLKAVGIGDANSRWGSCSSAGRIRYSWRLVLAPPEIRKYVVAHEVAHLVHLNHGAEFKALERRLFDGDVDSTKLLLRLIGPRLKRVGLPR